MFKFHVTIDIIHGQCTLMFGYHNAGSPPSDTIENLPNV